MNKEYFKNVFEAVDKKKDLIFNAERHIWRNPETGYREWKTSAYLEREFEKLGYKLIKPTDIPGFYVDINTGVPGPKILIFGELDSVICSDHPEANSETGAVHSCGHHAQCAALLGIAAAIKEEGVLDRLCGSIRLCAVPAEEGVDIEYREGLRKSGVIHYYSGKVEYMYRGYFDDVDMAIMVHIKTNDTGFSVFKGCNGNIKKRIVFKGIAAHAGGSPQKGINALYAATLGINAINALRETFVDDDYIRVHPIITKGGDTVNTIPNQVILESYVRGLTIDAIKDANIKVNRALAGAAASMGAEVIINDQHGALPLVNNKDMIDIAKIAMEGIVKPEDIKVYDNTLKSCTDMGDISAVIPSLHPYTSGAVGTLHGNDFYITDPEAACVDSSKFQLAMVKLLLSDNAKKAKKIIEKRAVRYPSIKAYFEEINRFTQEINAVSYKEDGSILIKPIT
jgi:amidohydrolase